MSERRVDVSGGRLHVVDEGAGPPIVLLHAGVADQRSWEVVVPGLAAAGYRVVTYDARGVGQSTTDDVGFSHRADLVALLDALAIERAVLVGNSRGGQTAFDTALEFPDRVAAIVGVAAGVGGFDGESTPAELEILEAYRRLDSAKPFDADALTEFEIGIWLDGPGLPPGRVDPATRESFRAMATALNERDPAGSEIRLDPPAIDRLGDLRCPVLAIAGGLDFSEVVQAARRIEAEAPDARALVWPDVAHMIGMEAPERLSDAIIAFLEPLDQWA
jgi:pimeloyl-ACP methyl ester carboxylesterase